MPKKTPIHSLPGIRLERAAALPQYRQLYKQISTAICSGRLLPGTRLPSTRAFANVLGVSRTVVVEAYEDLLAEGYIEGLVGAGTYVTRQACR